MLKNVFFKSLGTRLRLSLIKKTFRADPANDVNEKPKSLHLQSQGIHQGEEERRGGGGGGETDMVLRGTG